MKHALHAGSASTPIANAVFEMRKPPIRLGPRQAQLLGRLFVTLRHQSQKHLYTSRYALLLFVQMEQHRLPVKTR